MLDSYAMSMIPPRIEMLTRNVSFISAKPNYRKSLTSSEMLINDDNYNVLVHIDECSVIAMISIDTRLSKQRYDLPIKSQMSCLFTFD